MNHTILENGDSQDITLEQATALLALDIIYPCGMRALGAEFDCSSETQTVYHIHPEKSWIDVEEATGIPVLS